MTRRDSSAFEDPVRFEVLRHAFIAAVDEMSLMLSRVAHSIIVSEGDFSTAICNPAGDLVAEGQLDLPAHVGTLSATVKGSIEWVGRESIRPGDVILMNDPYVGGSHCQDMRTIKPVFWNGELVAFVLNSAHWSDAGGPVPGSFHTTAADAYGEALYVTPVRLVREGELDEDVMRLVLRNVRVPELTQGDIVGQLAALEIGEGRLHDLLEKYGRDVIVQQMDDLISYSERLLRAEFAQLVDGTYEFEDFVDFDPLGDRHTPIRVHVGLTIEGDRATFDFSGCDPQARAAINSPRSMTRSACMISLRNVFPHVPQNEGIIRSIELVLPEGLVVNPTFPATVNATFATTYEKMAACILGCFLQAIPERSMACSGNAANFIIGGFDPRPGFEQDYVYYLWREVGLGARPGKKDNHNAHPLVGSGLRNQPVELQERLYPIHTERYGLIADSAGAGRHRGAPGVARDIALTHGEGVLSIVSDRGTRAPWGYAGGHDSLPSTLVYAPGTSEELDIGMMASNVEIESGRAIEFRVSGGGGYGDPRERSLEWVLDDVVDELVSIEAARDVYGVVIELVDADAGEYRLDERATAALRAGAG
jgi:N-methylhydantoinase B